MRVVSWMCDVKLTDRLPSTELESKVERETDRDKERNRQNGKTEGRERDRIGVQVLRCNSLQCSCVVEG